MGVKGDTTVVTWAKQAGFGHKLFKFYDFVNGRRAAIDISCLLHKAKVFCVDQCLACPPNFEKMVNYIGNKIKILLLAGCTPVVVFDGAVPPGKEDEISRCPRAW